MGLICRHADGLHELLRPKQGLTRLVFATKGDDEAGRRRAPRDGAADIPSSYYATDESSYELDGLAGGLVCRDDRRIRRRTTRNKELRDVVA